MQDTIVCPECKRRLVLPPGVRDIMAQCPRCQTRFPSHPAAPEDAPAWPGPSPSPEPLAPDPRPESAPPPVPEKTPGKSGGRTAAWIVAVVVIAIGRWIFSGGAARQDRSDALREEQRLKELQRNPFGLSEEAMKRGGAAVGGKPTDLAKWELAIGKQEFDPVFDTLRVAFRASDGKRIASHYDPVRMVGEMADLELLRDQNPIAARDRVHALKKSLPKFLEGRAPVMAWSSLEILTIEKLPEDEAVVMTRLVNTKGESRTVRWRLIRRTDQWLVYDTEDVASGKRLCTSDDLVDATR